MSQTRLQSSESYRIAMVECEKRNKELDEREAQLIYRESLVDNGPLKLMVLEETIRARKVQLKNLVTKIEAGERKLKKQEAVAELNTKVASKELEAVKQKVAKHEGMIADAKRALSDIRAKQADVEKEVIERRKYRREQEQLIASATEEGNLTLRGLQLEIDGLQETKAALKIDIVGLEDQKTNAAYHAMQLLEEVKGLDKQVQETHDRLAKQAEEAKAALAKIGLENKRVTADTEEKLKQLDIKEREITVKREAMRLEEVKLATDRRRWESTKSLYNL